MFSKQHFVKFAELVKQMHDRKDQETLVIELLKMFKADNPRFDSARFLKAAGFESTQRTAPFEAKKPVMEAFEGFGKLKAAMPIGKPVGSHTLSEAPLPLSAETIRDLADDFDDAMDVVDNSLFEAIDGVIEQGDGIEGMNVVMNAIKREKKIFMKAFDDFRTRCQRIFIAKEKML